MKFISHIELTETGFKLSPYNKAYLLSYAQKNKGEATLIIKLRKRKSRNALGYYWGGILPAIIAHNKNLVHKGQLEHNPFIFAELIKEKKITKNEIDNLHRDIMFTFRPDIVKDLKTGKIHKVGQQLKENDNQYLIELITEICEAYEPQGYEFGEAETYKKNRDNPRLKIIN